MRYSRNDYIWKWAGVFLLSCGPLEFMLTRFHCKYNTLPYCCVTLGMHCVCSQDILQPTVAKGGRGGGGGEVGEEAGEEPEDTSSHKKTRRHRDRTSSDGTKHKKKHKSRNSAKDADQTF